MTEDTRDLFERTFKLNSRQQMKRNDGSYFYLDVQKQWEGWQAALATVPTERHALQAEGKHPAPCARHCEARAFEIEIRNLKAQLAAPAPAPSENLKTWPERVYLNHTDEGPTPMTYDEAMRYEDAVTWCDMRQEEADVEYVRADLATLLR
jgi:hypothetical protein